MAKQACKCKPTECEECPEWIFTFADLVMLMMGFFVILWVLKPAPGKEGPGCDDETLVKVLAAVRDYFSFVPDTQNPDKVDVYRLMKKLETMPPMKGQGDGGRTKLERRGAEGDQPEVLSIRQGDQAIVGSRVLFQAGSDALDATARRVLDQITLLIKGHRNIVLVKGHTSPDDFPEEADAQQKMDLSLRRAKVAADYLVAQGVEPDILRVLGCSTFEPVVQRAYTPDALQLNRRVEVEASNVLVPDRQGIPGVNRTDGAALKTATSQPATSRSGTVGH